LIRLILVGIPEHDAKGSGAMGPIQCKTPNWAAYGVDGNDDGKKDVCDPADAIPSAARLLKAEGAPDHVDAALFQYNHADWDVKKIRALATTYAGGQSPEALASATAGCAAVALVFRGLSGSSRGCP
jgi:membrane-bound lytic murein transglycosylase B